MTSDDISPRDALAVAQRALDKANQNEQARERVEELEDRVTALELRLNEREDRTPYDQLKQHEKVGRLRQHAFDKATDAAGRRTKITYDDVMWEVFSGNPSASHCYKLMRLAAGYTTEDASVDDDRYDELPGVTYRDPSDGEIHLAVDADRAKQYSEFFSENNTGGGEVAE